MSSSRGQRPLAPTAAVNVAKLMVGKATYRLGTGNWDTPFSGEFDCAGFAICRCYGLTRHRPGFNRGPWASVADDINVNSMIEDAQHHNELFTVASSPPQVGDLIGYPTIHLVGHANVWIGHVAIVVGVSRAADFDMSHPDWSLLDVVQCVGPDGRRPAVLASDASHWNLHDAMWPKPEHRSWLVRTVP